MLTSFLCFFFFLTSLLMILESSCEKPQSCQPWQEGGAGCAHACMLEVIKCIPLWSAELDVAQISTSENAAGGNTLSRVRKTNPTFLVPMLDQDPRHNTSSALGQFNELSRNQKIIYDKAEVDHLFRMLSLFPLEPFIHKQRPRLSTQTHLCTSLTASFRLASKVCR